jgi:hypothetical protein
MKTSKEFNNILDECLERLLVKDETIEQCLQSYPEQAAKLKPLLQTALAAQRVPIQPSADFKARARYQFHSALQEAAPRRSRSFSGWVPRWATVLSLALGLLLVGGGTVAAAGSSMPDSPLYPVKLATEQVQLMLTPSQIGKARLCAELADRRVTEIIHMANKGDGRQVDLITQRLDKRLLMLAALASTEKFAEAPRMMAPAPAPTPSEEAVGSGDTYAKADKRARLRMTVEHYAANHQEALQNVLAKAPESAKPALRRAIEISVADYEKALEALGEP